MAKIKSAYRRAPLSREKKIECLNDFAVFCETCVLIEDKNGKKVPLVLNRAQRLFADFLLTYIFAKNPKPITLVVLKARQMGFTTIVLALEVFVMIKFDNREYASINIKHFFHLGDVADEIMNDKMIPMLESLHTSFFGDFYTKADERKITCTNFKGQRRNNKVRYFTANSKEAGRGGTAQILILDEAAFYKSLGLIDKSVGSAVPTVGLSLQIWLSTANGINEFYDKVQLAQTSKDMEFLFLPWFIMEEYVRPIGDLKMTDLLDYEVKMIEEMKKWDIEEHLWLAKISWYRHHLETKKSNDLAAMRQEFPTFIDEPFVNSDTPVFPSSILIEALKDGAKEPIGYAINDDQGKIKEGTPFDIKIFAKPQTGRRYSMIIDPAMGGDDADNTAIRVIDNRTMTDAAVYASKEDPETIAELAVALARYYNNAIMNIENNMGHLLITLVKNLGYYSFYYHAQSYTKANPIPGIRMTTPVKRKGIDRLNFLINSGKYIPSDYDTLQELLHYNYVGKASQQGRRAEACGSKPDGTPYHDDLVMTLVNWVLSLPKRVFVKEGMTREEINNA